MSRILKFRAWVKRKNELMYLRGFRYSGNEKIKITFADEDKDDCTYTFLNKDVVLEQFTGLHDKNGVEIYEGDIVKIKHGNGYQTFEEEVEVAWDEYGFSPMNWQYECDGCSIYCEILEIEVIGNIHEVKQNEI